MMNKKTLPPEDRQLAEQLETLAQQLTPNSKFERELEKRLMNSQSPAPKAKGFFAHALPTLGWALGLILLAVTLTWVLRSVPPQPAASFTTTPSAEKPLPNETLPTPKPAGEVYERYGQTLYLQAELPSVPAEAAIYSYQTEQRATMESAHAFAAQMGMSGAIYKIFGEAALPPRDFLIVDGNQWLHVRSDQYFQYYPDYPRYVAAINGGTPPANSETLIEDFLQSHGFDFPHKILSSDIYGGYVAAPLTPDGRVICYEYFKCAGLHFQLDEQGILYVDGILPKYEPIGQYGIISAEEALQKFLDANGATGMMEGMTSFSPPIQTWVRARPLDQTISLYGYLNSISSAEGGAPLVTLDGIVVTGNTENIPPAYDNTFVKATGQFHEQNGVKTFALESWTIYSNGEEGLLGAISQQGERVILNTIDDEIFILPDIPADLSLPLDNAFVIGVRQGETFEWKSIDLRNAHGGGGRGGGLGFYKLNLTGTPVPFPTPESAPQSGGGGGGGVSYTVQAGDTLSKIASDFGISVETLTQVNGISDPSALQVGQELLIPGEPVQPQSVEGLRGMLSITIYKQADGNQRVEYGFITNADPYPYLLLDGENLEALQSHQNKPVEIWGTVETKDGSPPVLKVNRYEIPFPDLQFQILRGTQTPVTLNGQTATLFTTDNGKTYVQFNPGGGVDGSIIGNLEDVILIEALAIPDETFGSYPALRIFSAATAVSPKDGQAAELSISADQVFVVDLAAEGETIPPTLSIERVELVYYMPDPRYIHGELAPDQRTLQPAWLFTGHYSTGEEFFILIQALKGEFLLPEIAPYTQPG